MARYSHTGIFVVIAGFALVAGCEDGTTSGTIASRADTGQEAAASGGKVTEQDVEAPDVFAANENGLWDGRPSLGGVWVAHPDVRDPERVIIRNQANGTYVIGALFRRERENPGPRIQVSSDAASELGMLAGQPAELEVVALRREQVQSPSEEPAIAAAEAADLPDDAIAEPSGEAGVEVAALEAEEESASAKKGGFLGGLFKTREQRAEPVVQPDAALPTSEIETAALDPIASAGAAIDAAEASANAAPQAAAVASAPAPAAAPTSEPSPAASLQQPYVQIGIFSVSTNADETADDLRKAGLVPTVRRQNARGKEFWRVVVGPANTAEERQTIMAKVKDLGFSDAYYVTN